MDDVSGIYMIKNLINGRIYIGQSRHISERIKTHKKDLRNGYHHNEHLQNAYNKYGLDNFSFELVESCSIEDLDERERFWIEYYGSFESGYNLTSGGESNKIISEESRKKNSEAVKALWQDPEIKEKWMASRNYKSGEENPNFGREHTKEACAKMSASRVGKKASEETKQKMSAAHSGENNFCYGKKGKDHPSYGHRLSDEEKKRRSEKMKGANNPMFGRPVSEETRKKIGNAHRGEKNKHYGKPMDEKLKEKLIDIHKKKVICVETGMIFGSITEASEFLGVKVCALSAHLNGRSKSCKQTHWEYYRET